MFVRVGLRSVIKRGLLLSRTNATAAAVDTSPSIPPPSPPLSSSYQKETDHVDAKSSPDAPSTSKNADPASEKSQTHAEVPEKRTSKRKRPAISNATPRKWNPPMLAGRMPVYDLAVSYINKDARFVAGQAKQLQADIEVKEAQYQGQLKTLGPNPELEELDAQLEQMREKLNILDIQSQINLPAVRWRVRNSMVDVRNPVHLRLLEQRWRNEGDLDLLMERLHQMHVIPDVFPVLHPSVNLRVNFIPKGRILYRRRYDHNRIAVQPGRFLDAQQTNLPPHLFANVFHTETRLYTLLMVDPDVPDPTSESFTSYLHWLVPNIPLSASNGRMPRIPAKVPASYVPPHPQKGTPYHRYVLLLLPQPCAIDIAVISEEQRLGFDVRAFVKQYGLGLGDCIGTRTGGGAHMWRQVWDENVSWIYENVIKKSEPVYGRPPKYDEYEEFKNTPRYVAQN
ncbi:PEBP-like protein [Fistulina hepatica ATCC 64428]|uniref:PEBP-like protein n=1 Tax=Fistulina hepatica ATCC 64428 TaxID=1128425 RepID=A0A0D7A2S0_9AGAR|nr:PEBP-like protein [Fistulina hepatica ATCC 64428]